MVWRLISLGWWLFTGGVEKITTDSVWSDMYMVKFRGGLYRPSGNGGGHPAGTSVYGGGCMGRRVLSAWKLGLL